MVNIQLFSHIDRLAMNTWPAEITEACGSWIMRASEGVTKRANSVWTSDGSGEWSPNDGRMERIEAFYKAHGMPVRFHISDASPSGLDAWLERQGFIKEVPCLYMTADASKSAELTNTSNNDRFHAEALPGHDEEWLRVFIELEGHRTEWIPFYDKLFHRIEPKKGFLRIMCDEICVAVGTSVVQDGCAGFTNVVVHPDWRGQGIGKRLIHELAKWSLKQGARQLYLQVIADNEPAVKLYTGAGFERLFTYHYRTAHGE